MTTPKPVTVAKARLRNVGDGVIEFTDTAVKFYVVSGRFRKQRKIERDIPLAEIESVERLGDDLSVMWKGTTETFAIKQSSQVDTVYAGLTANLAKRKEETETHVTLNENETRTKLAQMTVNAIEIADFLFKILRNLHGRTDWKLVEDSYKQFEEKAVKFASLNANKLSLDLRPLSLAIQEHRAKDAAKETFASLKALYYGFYAVVTSVNGSEQLHPNPSDANHTIQSVYVVNDIMLGAIVGDEEITKENIELLKILDDLAKLPDSKIDVNAVKSSVEKIGTDKEKQEQFVEDIRLMLEQQLKELLPSETGSEQQKDT